jgi:hypothetical protein
MDLSTALMLSSGLGVLIAGYIGYRRGEPRGGVVCGFLLGPVLGSALIWLGTTERFATPEPPIRPVKQRG